MSKTIRNNRDGTPERVLKSQKRSMAGAARYNKRKQWEDAPLSAFVHQVNR